MASDHQDCARHVFKSSSAAALETQTSRADNSLAGCVRQANRRRQTAETNFQIGKRASESSSQRGSQDPLFSFGPKKGSPFARMPDQQRPSEVMVSGPIFVVMSLPTRTSYSFRCRSCSPAARGPGPRIRSGWDRRSATVAVQVLARPRPLTRRRRSARALLRAAEAQCGWP